MTVIVRFAPSPTGFLHVGNARGAVVNWLFARKLGGRFLLRIDDTDKERSRPAYEAAIRDDLAWLGLTWDLAVNQSDRLVRYDEAAARLKAAGRLYACYESAEELDAKRKRQLARHQPPVYDRAGLALSEAEKKAFEARGLKPHWRFLLEHREVRWDDLVRGPCHFDAASLSDPVLIREDGSPLYTLPSVVDDIDLAITHVIRGEDHATNTAAQIQLFEALGAKVPQFAHFSLLTDAGGQGLSKRLGSQSLADLRAAGIEPLALVSLLARLGSADPVVPGASLDALAAGFDLSRLGRAAAKFDPAELLHLNARLLHNLSFAEAGPRLQAMGIEGDESFWLAVRENLGHFAEAAEWWRICRQPVGPVIEDAPFLAVAAGLLPPEPWDANSWKDWTAAIAACTGRKGKMLFHPLRLALTGRENGPELKSLLPLIGRSRALARLGGQAA